MKITKEQIYQKSKKMSSEELQQHLKNISKGASVHKNAKKYNRKSKHRKAWA